MLFPQLDRIVLFGGGDVLAWLSVHVPYMCSVITSPRHASETLFNYQTTLEKFLQESKVDFSVVDSIDESFLSKFCSNNTLAISFGAAWIFRSGVINFFKGRLLNSHGSLLPQDRGAGGFSWRILMGDTRGCSLLHQIDEGVDTGHVVDYDFYIFPEYCRRPIDYYSYSFEKYKDFFNVFFKKIESSYNFNVTEQPEYLSTYWPRLNTEINGFIDWSWSLEDIVKFICAFDEPYCGASTFINGEKVVLKSCRPMYGLSFHPFQTGIVYKKCDNFLFVACKNGTLIVEKVSGLNNFNALNSISTGDRFFTPQQFIENSMLERVKYTTRGISHCK